jgi:mono/diheme cytochrome c family protein
MTLFRLTAGVLGIGLAEMLCSALPARADDSAALYKAKCETCHAKDGSGNTQMGKTLKAHDLRALEVQKMSDAELNAAITNGKGATMPAYKGKLTDAQIKGLVDYVRNLVKK